MSKKLIEQLHPVGFATQAKRIEELERKVASRDAEVVSLTNQRDYEYVRAENAEQERDQLREQVKMLRDALEFVNNRIGFSSTETYRQWEDIVEKALAATEPKE